MSQRSGADHGTPEGRTARAVSAMRRIFRRSTLGSAGTSGANESSAPESPRPTIFGRPALALLIAAAVERRLGRAGSGDDPPDPRDTATPDPATARRSHTSREGKFR